MLLAIAVGYLANDIRRMMRYDLQVRFNDNSCRLLETLTPCEDVTAFGDGESAFAGGGDLWTAFKNGSIYGTVDGAVWLVNAKQGTMRAVPIKASAPDGQVPKLILNGIF